MQKHDLQGFIVGAHPRSVDPLVTGNTDLSRAAHNDRGGKQSHQQKGPQIGRSAIAEGKMRAPGKPRKTLGEFAEAMERTLTLHDDRPGWTTRKPEWLLRRLREETEELEAVLPCHGKSAMAEAVDVANFAMMIWDVMRRREKRRLQCLTT